MNDFKIRAHHGMCLAFFQGKGYSDGFTAHMRETKERLSDDPVVTVIADADVICGPCPNNQNGCCISAEKVSRYDREVLARCGIEPGTEISYGEFEKLVRENILDVGKRAEICGDCQWDSICRE